MTKHVASHPLIAHKMTHLRDVTTSPADFRRLLKEITFYLGYEATRDFATTTEVITTPTNTSFDGVKLAERVAIIPILRAGLGMSDAMLELLPNATVHHIGMYRSKDSLLPVEYYNRLPKNQPCDVAYIMDPCIATSNTISAVVSMVKRWGAKRVVVISAIAAAPGIEKLEQAHPDVQLFVGALDDKLSEDGMIVPGIGDAGDRQYSTPEVAVNNKRARED